MPKRNLVMIFSFFIILNCNVMAIDVASWQFDKPTQNLKSIEDSVKNLVAKVVSRKKKHITVMPIGKDSAVIFDNSKDDSDINNSMLVIEDNDILTGHIGNEDGFKSLTIEIEFKPKEIKQCQLVRKTAGSTDVGYQLWMTKDGKIGFSVCSRKGKLGRVVSKRKIKPGEWHKVVATWDGRYEVYNMQVHVDGYISWSGGVHAISLTSSEKLFYLARLFFSICVWRYAFFELEIP